MPIDTVDFFSCHGIITAAWAALDRDTGNCTNCCAQRASAKLKPLHELTFLKHQDINIVFVIKTATVIIRQD